MRRLRVLVHALDRTGPPVLARTFVRWLGTATGAPAIDVVAFRGGPLEAEVRAIPGVRSVTVVTEPDEPWDHVAPDAARVAQARRALAALPPADASLLVSVAAGQALPLLDDPGGVVTWVVEQGDDLHWLDGPLALPRRTHRWLAGTEAAASEAAALLARHGGAPPIAVQAEFVAAPAPNVAARADRVRAALGLDARQLLVVGAGIATHRKAPDLFLEVALAVLRGAPDLDATFRWVGGDRDPLFPVVAEEAERLGVADRVALVPPVEDVEAWLAAADVVVHPARLDAFPLVCLHAALVATPVASFAQVAASEVMFGDAALTVPYPDVAALAGLVEALADPTRRREAGEAQRRAAHRWLVQERGPELLAHLEAAAAAAHDRIDR